MKKINSKQTGNSTMSTPQIIAAVGLVVVWMCIVIISSMIGLSTYAIILIMALCGGSIAMVFFVYVYNKARFDSIVTRVKYMLRRHRGETLMSGFSMPLDELRKRIPIKRVLEDGLIEYEKKQYGVMIRYDPPPVSKGSLEVFHKQIEYLVNSFGPGIEASFHFYNMIDHNNPLADTILQAINTDGKTLEQKEHLHGMYEYATANDEPFVATSFLLAVKLGKFKSPELANIAYKSTIPGILKAMRECGIYGIQLIGESEIAIECKQFAVMEKCQWI